MGVTSFTNPGFLFPCSIAFCSEKREAFILDKRQSIIFVVSPEFAVTGSICREGRKPGQLSSPTDLVFESGDGDILILIINLIKDPRRPRKAGRGGHRQ